MRLRKTKKSLNDVMPNWLSGNGIMSTLTTNFDVPWKEVYLSDLIALDIAYQGARSGRKWIAPFLEYFVSDTVTTITDEDMVKIASALWATYRRKWEKLWELYMAEYNPLDNYDVKTETEEEIQSTGTQTGTVETETTDTFDKTDTTTKTGTVSNDQTTEVAADDTTKDTGTQSNNRAIHMDTTDNKTIDFGRTETDEKTGTETTIRDEHEYTDTTVTEDGKGTQDNQLFGFNSTSAVDSDAMQSTDTKTTVTDGDVHTSGRTVVEYALKNLKTMGGQDKETLSRHEEGTVVDTRTDDLTSVKSQSSLTTIKSALTNDLTDITKNTGTVGTESLVTNDLANTDNANRTMKEHKYGNIGVSSIQRMFREEVENWTWNFMNAVFEDIDSLLVLAVY